MTTVDIYQKCSVCGGHTHILEDPVCGCVEKGKRISTEEKSFCKECLTVEGTVKLFGTCKHKDAHEMSLEEASDYIQGVEKSIEAEEKALFVRRLKLNDIHNEMCTILFGSAKMPHPFDYRP